MTIGMAVKKKTLVIFRDDHIGEPIGAIFFGLEEGEPETARRVCEYLGNKVRVLKIELDRDRVVVDVEASIFTEESDRMASAAADLIRKGAPRNAIAMFKQALELDPLGGQALYDMGLALLELKKPPEALAALRRAREILGDSADLLRSLAGVSVKMERVPTAIGYLERALDLEPGNRAIQRELRALGRGRPPAPLQLREAARRRRR